MHASGLTLAVGGLAGTARTDEEGEAGHAHRKVTLGQNAIAGSILGNEQNRPPDRPARTTESRKSSGAYRIRTCDFNRVRALERVTARFAN